MDKRGMAFLRQYELSIAKTDRFSRDEITPILMGLYGEVGSIMATSKKFYRERKAYAGHRKAVEEEFGDAFWYLSALCRRLSIDIENAIENACNGRSTKARMSGTERITSSVSKELDTALISLGFATAQLLRDDANHDSLRYEVSRVAIKYCDALRLTDLDFRSILEGNLTKTLGRFATLDREKLEDFDASFPEDEKLPQHFEIHITQRKVSAVKSTLLL